MALQAGYDTSAGLVAATRTNLPLTNYTNVANRRLLVTDIHMDSTDAAGTRIFLEDITNTTDHHSMFLPAAGSLHRSFIIPIEFANAVQIGLDATQGGGTTAMSAGWQGRDESP